MKKQIFRFILVGILVFVFAMPMLGCGSRDYEFTEEDFRLTFEVSQTEARVGDTIVATATFENLSGRRIRVQGMPPFQRNIEDLLVFAIIPEYVGRGHYNFFPVAGRIRQLTLRRNAVIEKQREFVIGEEIDHVAFARFSFSQGRETHTSQIHQEEERVWVRIISEEIKIIIQGENTNEN
ncbi:MAG: hypothetical protein FWE22_07590 [Firmicutes bacterium]|nr:hypothetical protein [Bacillota bacterium]